MDVDVYMDLYEFLSGVITYLSEIEFLSLLTMCKTGLPQTTSHWL